MSGLKQSFRETIFVEPFKDVFILDISEYLNDFVDPILHFNFIHLSKFSFKQLI